MSADPASLVARLCPSCPSCGSSVVPATTTDGDLIAMDPFPVRAGGTVDLQKGGVNGDGTGGLLARVLTDAEAAAVPGLLHVVHACTQPEETR